jgi:hypothetical protein
MQKEAMNGKFLLGLPCITNLRTLISTACIRKIAYDRLTSSPLSLERVLLPLGATKEEPHVPILISPSLSSSKHIVLVIGESNQDLGIFAYRHVGAHGINAGSGVGFATTLNSSKWGTTDTSTPGLIFTNPAQLYYHRRTHTPMTLVTWHAIPRQTAVSLPPRIAPGNRTPFNETAADHMSYVLNNILSNPDYVSKDAKLYIVGIAEGGASVVKYLASHWTHVWESRIAAIALTDPQHSIKNIEHEMKKQVDPGFKDFLGARTRAYCLSEEPMGTPLEGRKLYGCNCYASGEAIYGEAALPFCMGDLLGWFKLVAGLGGRYREVDVPDGDEEGMEEVTGTGIVEK